MREDVVRYLKEMVEKNASHIVFSTGTAPHVKTGSGTVRLTGPEFGSGNVRQLAAAIMNPKQAAEFEANLCVNFPLSVKGAGRFRVNVYQQRGEASMVIHHVKARVATLAELGLPPALQQLALARQGLVLVVGATGAGKSATLAGLVDHRNTHLPGHILCVDDPMEYLHPHRKAVVDQREIGLDAPSMREALSNAMHQCPDVVAIGEIRDRDTMQQALAFADTGHLCLATLRANNAAQAVQRIVGFFPEDARRQVLTDLALNLEGIVAQRLVPGLKTHRVPAVEVLLRTSVMSEMVQSGRAADLAGVIARGAESGMTTFDDSLLRLYQAGSISMEEALRNADSQTDLKLQIRLMQPGGVAAAVPSGLEAIVERTGHGSRK